MNDLLGFIEDWEQSKSKVFKSEGFEVCITDDLDNEIKSRYIEIFGNGVEAKATQWEDGFLELSLVDDSTKEILTQESHSITTQWELEEKLNWLLSELDSYEA